MAPASRPRSEPACSTGSIAASRACGIRSDRAWAWHHAGPAGGAGRPRLGRQSSRRRGGVHDRRAMRPALILFVDDEKAIQRSMVPLLRSRGYLGHARGDWHGRAGGLDAERPDLVVLDLGLPDMDGTVVVERIRARSDVPVLILSARLTEPARSRRSIVAPTTTSPSRSLRRVARARARGAQTSARTGAGDAWPAHRRVDPNRSRAPGGDVAGPEVHLTPKEFDLVSLLAARAGQVVTHRAILRAIWGPHESRSTRAPARAGGSVEKENRRRSRAPHAPAHRALGGISLGGLGGQICFPQKRHVWGQVSFGRLPVETCPYEPFLWKTNLTPYARASAASQRGRSNLDPDERRFASPVDPKVAPQNRGTSRAAGDSQHAVQAESSIYMAVR